MEEFGGGVVVVVGLPLVATTAVWMLDFRFDPNPNLKRVLIASMRGKGASVVSRAGGEGRGPGCSLR